MDWKQPFDILWDVLVISVGWMLIAVVVAFTFFMTVNFAVAFVKSFKKLSDKKSPQCVCGKAHK